MCRPIQVSACGFFPPRMDVDGTRTLCSRCEVREVYNIGQETPQCPFFGNCTPYKTVFVSLRRLRTHGIWDPIMMGSQIPWDPSRDPIGIWDPIYDPTSDMMMMGSLGSQWDR